MIEKFGIHHCIAYLLLILIIIFCVHYYDYDKRGFQPMKYKKLIALIQKRKKWGPNNIIDKNEQNVHEEDAQTTS